MIKQNKSIGAINLEIERVSLDFLKCIAPIEDNKINLVPFEGSWTVAQVIIHVTKSNNGIVGYFLKPGVVPTRQPDSGVETLKKIFLDFETKLNSPDFILPAPGEYDKSEVVSAFRKSFESIFSAARDSNLVEEVDHPIFKKITKLELAHFVVYHTQRHIHQLEKIKKAFE